MESIGCDWLLTELGPPPDAILRIPPPPLPHFVDRVFLQEIALAAAGIDGNDRENETSAPCHWCHWARRLDSVGTISVTLGTEMALEDTWFFVILASCLMITLGALLSGLIYLRLNGKTFKGAWDFSSFLSENGSILIGSNGISVSSTGERHPNTSLMMPVLTSSQHEHSKPNCLDTCSSTSSGDRFPHNCNGGVTVTTTQRHVTHQESLPPLTRALWAGVKTSEGNHYTITHAQPVDQKLHRSSLPPVAIQGSQQPDEDSAGYTTLNPCASAAIADPNAENNIYYCCTDLILVQQPSTSTVMQQVTSLDDPTECSSIESINPMYVNMSPLIPLGSPKLDYPLVNPIYPSPCKPQLYREHVKEEAATIGNQYSYQVNNSVNTFAHPTSRQLSYTA